MARNNPVDGRSESSERTQRRRRLRRRWSSRSDGESESESEEGHHRASASSPSVSDSSSSSCSSSRSRSPARRGVSPPREKTSTHNTQPPPLLSPPSSSSSSSLHGEATHNGKLHANGHQQQSDDHREVVSFEQLQALRHVELVVTNEFPLSHLTREKLFRRQRHDAMDDDSNCFCTFPEDVEDDEADNADNADDEQQVDPESAHARCNDLSCINFATYVECSPQCDAGRFCMNQRLQHPERFPKLQPFKTEKKGFGVRTMQTIAKGSVVGEYVGEVIDQKEMNLRLASMARNELNFYYLLLMPGVYIDARRKGSFTRFVNHSCEPNCKTEKWSVGGENRIAVVALREINQGEELTFDYQWKSLGSRQIKCFCESPNCKGYIGTSSDDQQRDEIPEGIFREPRKDEIGPSLVNRRIRYYPSKEDHSIYHICIVKSVDEANLEYQVEYEEEYSFGGSGEEDLPRPSSIRLHEAHWHLYVELEGLSEDQKQKEVFSIPKLKRPVAVDAKSTPASASSSPTRPVSDFPPKPPTAMQPVPGKLLLKNLPRLFHDHGALARLLGSKERDEEQPLLLHSEVFSFDDGRGWALVDIRDAALIPQLIIKLDARPLKGQTLRVVRAGKDQVDSFFRLRDYTYVRKQHASTKKESKPKDHQDEDASSTGTVEETVVVYGFGRKLNWLVTVEQMEESPSRQRGISSSLEESLRHKCMGLIVRVARRLNFDPNVATSAILALHRVFTFFPMDTSNAEMMAAAMLHLFVKAHAQKYSWKPFVAEVYEYKYGGGSNSSSSSSQKKARQLTSSEFEFMEKRIRSHERELLEHLQYDLSSTELYNLLDRLMLLLLKPTPSTTEKFASACWMNDSTTAKQKLLNSIPSALLKEVKRAFGDTLNLPIWTYMPAACVVLSVLYLSTAAAQVLSERYGEELLSEDRERGVVRTSAPLPRHVENALPVVDAYHNELEAAMFSECCSSLGEMLKPRWKRLEEKFCSRRQKALHKQQKDQGMNDGFAVAEFDVVKPKEERDAVQEILHRVKEWITTNKRTSRRRETSSCSSSSRPHSGSSHHHHHHHSSSRSSDRPTRWSSSSPSKPSSASPSKPSPSTTPEPPSSSMGGMRESGVCGTFAQLAAGVRDDFLFTRSSSSDCRDGGKKSMVPVISAASVIPRQVFAKTNTAVLRKTPANDADRRLVTDQIEQVERIRKRTFLGRISNQVPWKELADQPVLLQPWPYRTAEEKQKDENVINENGVTSADGVRELCCALDVTSLAPERFVNLLALIFPTTTKSGSFSMSSFHASDATKNNASESNSQPAAPAQASPSSTLSSAKLDPSSHFLAFEKPLHTVAGIMDAHIRMPMELRKRALYDLVEAVALCHENNFVHRSISGCHVYVFQHRVKLGGYFTMRRVNGSRSSSSGDSHQHSKNSASSSSSSSTGSATPSSHPAYELSEHERKEHLYGSAVNSAAPEILLGDRWYTWRSDMWALGITILDLLLDGKPLLRGSDVKSQLDLIFRQCGTPNTVNWENATHLAYYKSLKPKNEYKFRLTKTLAEKQQADFPLAAMEVLEHVLQLDPLKRKSARELLQMEFFKQIAPDMEPHKADDTPSTPLKSSVDFAFSNVSSFDFLKKKMMQQQSRLSRHPARPHHGHGHGQSQSHARDHSHHRNGNHHSSKHKSRISRQDDSSSDQAHSSKRHRSSSAIDEEERAPPLPLLPLIPLPVQGDDGYGKPVKRKDGSLVETSSPRPSKKKRVSLGWGMGLNSTSPNETPTSTPSLTPTPPTQTQTPTLTPTPTPAM